jgi:hypothetical protein
MALTAFTGYYYGVRLLRGLSYISEHKEFIVKKEMLTFGL